MPSDEVTIMRTLYSQTEYYARHSLEVAEPHILHVEEYGNPGGVPVVFLHGGPGAGCEPWHTGFFDPSRYRVVLFDQRGAGRSTPHASLQDNTTADLVTDLETLRNYLGIDAWVVFGGSWGSTLGLVYAEVHPERVLGLILRGIFLCRPQEIDWFYRRGASRLFPDYWQDFIAAIPEEERDDLVKAYYQRLAGDNELARMAAAKAWSLWEGRTATLLSNPAVEEHFANPYVALALARIECHYFVHDSFLEPNQLLRDAGRLKDIPGVIVHGRYDVICPLENAWDLHRTWPGSELHIIADAGHSAAEPGTMDALIEATDAMLVRLGQSG
jgi:proline iminopeptidase